MTAPTPEEYNEGDMTGKDLPDRLGAWVDAGLITRDQADAIEAHEATAPDHDLPKWVEPVAYLGAALVAVALFLFGIEVWDRLAPWGRISLAAVVTLVLLGAGTALRRSDAAPARRAASFSWFLAVAGVAATTGLILFDALDIPGDWASLATALVTFVAALGLYLMSNAGLQQVAMAVGAVATIATIPEFLPLADVWVATMMFFALGVVWMLFVWAGMLRPPGAGWAIGALLTLTIGFATFESGTALWSIIGIAAGLGLVFLSTRVDSRALLGIGVLGLVVWIPATVTNLFESSIAVPVAILVTGVVTLTVVIAALRLRAANPPDALEPVIAEEVGDA